MFLFCKDKRKVIRKAIQVTADGFVEVARADAVKPARSASSMTRLPRTTWMRCWISGTGMSAVVGVAIMAGEWRPEPTSCAESLRANPADRQAVIMLPSLPVVSGRSRRSRQGNRCNSLPQKGTKIHKKDPDEGGFLFVASCDFSWRNLRFLRCLAAWCRAYSSVANFGSMSTGTSSSRSSIVFTAGRRTTRRSSSAFPRA